MCAICWQTSYTVTFMFAKSSSKVGSNSRCWSSSSYSTKSTSECKNEWRERGRREKGKGVGKGGRERGRGWERWKEEGVGKGERKKGGKEEKEEKWALLSALTCCPWAPKFLHKCYNSLILSSLPSPSPSFTAPTSLLPFSSPLLLYSKASPCRMSLACWIKQLPAQVSQVLQYTERWKPSTASQNSPCSSTNEWQLLSADAGRVVSNWGTEN